jgi:ABC-type nickel/cobalt efflux system permease component RcnA
MIVFLTGFIASMAHVVTGPDHLAAVTPLAIESRKKSWIIGFSWGLGHTIGMLLIGLLFLLFKEFLPVESISKHSETVIGVLLICIGLWAILRIFVRHNHQKKPHPHFHVSPDFYAHIHEHTHHNKTKLIQDHGHEHLPDGIVKQNSITAMGIGMVHGFAGFSHLFALLPSLALPTKLASIIYIGAFAVGTILAMMIFAYALGFVAFKSVVQAKLEFLKWFTFSGALLAIAIGVLWIFNPL